MNDPIELLHDRTRLSILSLLATGQAGEISFTSIQENMNLTSGNLSSHLRMLETHQLITISKQFKGKRPHTTIHITPLGYDTMERFIQEMEELISSFKEQADSN